MTKKTKEKSYYDSLSPAERVLYDAADVVIVVEEREPPLDLRGRSGPDALMDLLIAGHDGRSIIVDKEKK